MKIQMVHERIDSCDTLVLFLTKEDEIVQNPFISDKTIQAMKEREDFTGALNETALIFEKKSRVLLVGLGKTLELDKEKMRHAAAIALKHLKKLKNAKEALVELPEVLKKDLVSALIEGLVMTGYEFTAYKKSSSKLENLYLLASSKSLDEDFLKLKKIQEGVDLARELVNLNADTVTPSYLVHKAQELSKKYPKIKTTILRRKELEKMEAGLILAVSQGASEEPALIIMEYMGHDDETAATEAFLGKGITYDTGGLNLKPTGSMESMKCDMAGSACIMGFIQACAELKIKKNIIGCIASCENAIGPESYRPGDVFKSLSGKTVEINNTDAEGRLVLADAVTYLQKEHKVTSIIDLATLTGAITIALGEEAAGLFTRDVAMEEKLLQASVETGEKLWPMPLYNEFKDQLKSSIADLKNSGKRMGGASTGALFIEAFVEEKTSWAHLDIAGVAYLSEPRHYHTSLATGFGVRLLLNYLGV